MPIQQTSSVEHTKCVHQWLDASSPVQNGSDALPVEEESDLATKLYVTCLEMLRSLCQSLSAQKSLRKQSFVLREELGKLFLWGESMRSGELDRALTFSEELRDLVLKKMIETGRLLLDIRNLPDIVGVSGVGSQVSLPTLLERGRMIITRRRVDKEEENDDDSSSDNSSDEDNTLVTHDFWHMIRRIRTQNSQLARISPTIRRSLARMEKEENKSKSVYLPIVSFQVTSAAATYISLIRDRFAQASSDLVERLGEANWERHQEIRSGRVDGQTAPAESASTAIFRPVSTFHDSGLGTSMPNESNYAPSHTSFLSTNSTEEAGGLRVPSTPREVQEGKPFECFLCKKVLTDIKNRVAWKVHVFADLRPYICTFSGCKAELAQFPSRTEWGEHEFKEHRITRTWRCHECPVACPTKSAYEKHAIDEHGRQQDSVAWQMSLDLALETTENPADQEQCPLCCSIPGGSRRAFVNHVARHMDQIALLALPRDAEDSDDGSDTESHSEHNPSRAAPASTVSGSTEPGIIEKPSQARSTSGTPSLESFSTPPLLTSPTKSSIGPPPLPWTPQDDEVLVKARQQGMDWQSIANAHFPAKTANACRKRHERLMKKGDDAAGLGPWGKEDPQNNIAPKSEAFEDPDRLQFQLAIDISNYLNEHSPPSIAPIEKSRQKTRPEEATHECEVCGEAFRRKPILKRHMDECHDLDPNFPHHCTGKVGDKPCQKKYKRKADLDRHYDSIHGKARKHVCDLCGNRFALPETLKRHNEDGCPKRFGHGLDGNTKPSAA